MGPRGGNYCQTRTSMDPLGELRRAKTMRTSYDYWVAMMINLSLEIKFIGNTATSPYAYCRRTKDDTHHDLSWQRVPKLTGNRGVFNARL